MPKPRPTSRTRPSAPAPKKRRTVDHPNLGPPERSAPDPRSRHRPAPKGFNPGFKRR